MAIFGTIIVPSIRVNSMPWFRRDDQMATPDDYRK